LSHAYGCGSRYGTGCSGASANKTIDIIRTRGDIVKNIAETIGILAGSAVIIPYQRVVPADVVKDNRHDGTAIAEGNGVIIEPSHDNPVLSVAKIIIIDAEA
jgi:hypothetical protein